MGAAAERLLPFGEGTRFLAAWFDSRSCRANGTAVQRSSA